MAQWKLGCLFALVAMGCSVEDVDLEGKSCSPSAPCPDGLVCEDGACRRTGSICEPIFHAEEFRVAWQTTQSVRFSWQPKGDGADFVQYKLVLGQTSEELAKAQVQALAGENDGPGGAIWTQADNPELGQYEFRLSGGVDPVTESTTDGLTEGAEYQARLLTYDSAGCVDESQVAVARTQAASLFEFELFDEAPNPAGAPRPENSTVIQTDASRAFVGQSFLHWPGWPDGSTPGGSGYESVGVYQLGTEPELHYPSLDLSSGFLELAVAIDGASVAAWGEVRLILGPSPGVCDGIEAASIKAFAFRPGGYQLLQLPLDQFRLRGEPLEKATLLSRSICEVSVGRSWAPGETVRVDAIRLRW